MFEKLKCFRQKKIRRESSWESVCVAECERVSVIVKKCHTEWQKRKGKRIKEKELE